MEEVEVLVESPRSLIERLNITVPEPTDRLRPFESIANITSWRNAARADTSTAQGNADNRSAAGTSRREGESTNHRTDRRGNRQRSASPTRFIAVRTPFPRDQPIALFRNNLRKIAHCITYHQRLYPITRYLDWNPLLLEKGVLILPDPRAEVRMCYFANCINCDIRHVSTLLSLAIEHRFSFRIAVRKSDVKLFTPRRISQTTRVMGSSLYSADYRESTLTFTTATSFFATYTGRIADLLNRPNGPAFIGLGGPCSWLAHRWGGDKILKRFMTGPSIQTTVFEKGASDIRLSNPQGLVWDDVSGQDIELLFGYVPHATDRRHDRWLYPPPHIIEQYCVNWSGEWNWVMETIFCYITDKLMEIPCAWEPKCKGSWKTWLRTYNRGRYKPAHTLTQEYVDDIINGFRLARLPPSWNQQSLSSIHIPESSDD